MKLLKLYIENFGSVENVSIDFTEIQAATISGTNGSGKSTIFVDAPLWCLFGKCRSDTDSMIRLGQQKMAVFLQFELDGERYHVERTRSKSTKAGKTSLTFIHVDPDGKATPIGEGKVMETQEAIRSVLNADYDLVTATNFLVQGQSDRFTKATSGERKAILAQILRLDVYEDLRSLAAKRGIELDAVLRVDQEVVGDLEGQMAQKAEAEKETATLTEAIQQFNAEAIATQTRLAQAQETLGQQEAAMKELGKVRTLLEEKKQAQGHSELRAKNLQAQLEKAQAFQLSASAILDAERLLPAAKEAITELDHLCQANSLDAQKKTEAISEYRERKVTEEATLERVQQQLKDLYAEGQRAQTKHREELERKAKDLELAQGRVGSLDTVPCYDLLKEKCPYTLEAFQLRNDLPKMQAQFEQEREMDPVKETIPGFSETEATRLQQIESLKKTQTPAVLAERQAELDKVKEQGAQLAVERGKAIVRHSELESVAKQAGELRANEQVIATVTAGLDAEKTTLKNLNTEVEGLVRDVADYSLHVTMIDQTKLSIKDLTTVADSTREAINTASTNLGKCRAVIEELKGQIEKGLAKQREMESKTLERSACASLVEYYKRIPIFLMEEAVPNLEAACNEILGRISPSGMTVALETQKALKATAGMTDTLDIVVRDRFGERPYENYSGGERFRLDLALRLAMADLLRHRAGSKLETLVIDEGLGSLDQEGLELLRECLASLEDRYPCILVVSHVEAILGTFPTSIQVTKPNETSQVEVSQ